MSAYSIQSVEPAKIIYLVEKQQPPAKKEVLPPSLFEKVKCVVGKILFGFSVLLLCGAAFAFVGHVFSLIPLASATVEMLFTSSLLGMLGGYYLSVPTSIRKPNVEIGIGPLAVSI